MYTDQRYQPPQTHPSRKRSLLGKFAHNVAAKLAASAILKLGLVVLAIAVGTGAFAAVKHFQHNEPGSQPVSTGVVLTKLISLNDFHAAQADYNFDFTYVVHKGFLFFTGESIHAVGTGTDEAIVDFSQVDVTRINATSVKVVLPQPTLGTPAVNLSQTTLTEHGGVLTHLSHVIKNDPNDAREALAAAQNRIGAAAANSDLIATGSASTKSFLDHFLKKLGITHVTVDFI